MLLTTHVHAIDGRPVLSLDGRAAGPPLPSRLPIHTPPPPLPPTGAHLRRARAVRRGTPGRRPRGHGGFCWDEAPSAAPVGPSLAGEPPAGRPAPLDQNQDHDAGAVGEARRRRRNRHPVAALGSVWRTRNGRSINGPREARTRRVVHAGRRRGAQRFYHRPHWNAPPPRASVAT